MEEDVLQAEPLLPTQGAVQRHPALLHSLPHLVLEGNVSFLSLHTGCEESVKLKI